MLKLILYRSLQGLIVLLIVSLLVFGLLAATGGDALTSLANDPRVSEETLAALRRIYGFDQPLLARYAQWLTDAALGRLGHSFYFQTPVAMIIWPRFLNTLALAVAALIIAWMISLTLGITAAQRAGGWIDRTCGALVLVASSTPRLVLALLVLVFAVRTTLFGIGGSTIGLDAGAWLWRLIPPAFVLSFPLTALFLAQTRANVGAMLDEDFIRVARAKGLRERAVLLRHALRPSLNPLITVFGYSLGGLVSGSVIVEKVLGFPGLGQLIVIAVQSRDVPLLMGSVMVTATSVLIGNLLADILLRLNDPRLR
jgi:peptide/nickel transport system permease protein